MAAVTLCSQAGRAASFQNGDFGIGPSFTDPFITLYNGDTSITGWTVTGHSIDYIGTYWQAPPGATRSIDLDGLGQGGIQQTFDTISGAQYQVRFYLAGNPDGAPSTKNILVVSWGTPAAYSFDASGATLGNMGWILESFTFTAEGPSTTLQFNSQDSGYYGPALGGVNVSQIPLPATALLLGTGLLGLGLLGFRRKKQD
ncbi:MAG: hypothetical protein A2Y80_09890 [Deltaproteobacteria bacterium RBG_13_58_19]|nr:MAG: hypothetical protein A2Y80_09890 [Deltaproteobacteria bacterium RBG_13_58_19]